MAERAPCYLFKETRVNLDWGAAGTTINIVLPRHHSGRSERSSVHKIKPQDNDDADPEAKFNRTYLASSASVYYRPVDRYPRCILWRVLEDEKVLSLTSVDFTKPNDGRPEFRTTFRFYFPDKIKPNCIGFADAPDHDELVVYLLTFNNILYTLSLTPDFLLRNSVTRKSSKDSDYCRTFSPSSFLLHTPHFLAPINHQSLLISLQDGSILKLEKSAGMREDPESTQSRYVEKTFSEGNYLWAIGSKLPWATAGTVRYKRDNVSHSTVISSAIYTPKDDQNLAASRRYKNAPLMATVSVNHTLKVWSLDRGTLLHSTDLLDEPQNSASSMKTLLDPSPSHLLAVIDASFQEDHLFYLASFSSATTGKFKFWAALCDENGQFEKLVDLYPNHEFQVDPPTAGSVWIISEFKISFASSTDPSLMILWVLWKSNKAFRVQNLQFRIQDVPATWNKWTTATPDSLHGFPGRAPLTTTSEDVTDYYMDWIFFPGRFPNSVLETALKIYESNFLMPTDNDKEESIQARVARVVSSAVEMQKNEMDGSVDYVKYRYEMGLQWDRFCRLCTELDKQRVEALSLVADPDSGFVWTVNADGVTALRECTETELLQHNFPTFIDNLDILSERNTTRLGAGLKGVELSDAFLLVRAAADLRSSLSDRVYGNCHVEIQDLVVEDPRYSVMDQMCSIYNHCLEEEVTENAYEKIENAFEAMDDPERAFNGIISSLFHNVADKGKARLSSFGEIVMVIGSQEVIHVNQSLLFDLFFLLVLVSQDDGRPFSRIENPEQLYTKLLGYVKEYEILNWASKNSLAIPGQISAEEEIVQGLTDLRILDTQSLLGKKGSVLHVLLSENFGPPPPGPGRHGSLALSACIRHFLTSLDLTEYGNGVTNIVSTLLNINAIDLAVEFLKYLPSTAWGCYMKARVELKHGNTDTSLLMFKKASYQLATLSSSHFSVITPFLNEIEIETSMGKGLPNYFLHVAMLYEDSKVPGLVVEACKAGLLSLIDENLNVKSSLLTRLFHAAIQISLFDEAYLALTNFPDSTLQRNALRDLAGAMVEQNEGAKLCSYPFIGLQDEVDEALAFKCQSILDVSAGPPFHKVLYAWRIQRGDYRGAAVVLHERLQRLQNANIGSKDPNSRSVTDGFLALMNVMSCVGEDQAWILSSKRVDTEEGLNGTSAKRARLSTGALSSNQRRQVLTMSDIKHEYQHEVERMGLLLNGGFFV
ncbi:hypothetical protein RUND412_003954 [Rhizina undulata]